MEIPKIELIKLVRNLMKIGLIEAKNLVELFIHGTVGNADSLPYREVSNFGYFLNEIMNNKDYVFIENNLYVLSYTNVEADDVINIIKEAKGE